MRYGGSVYDSAEHSARWTRDVEVTTPEEFVGLPRACAGQRVARKEDSPLLCASFINGGRRCLDNVLGSTGLWFDHDGKDGITEPDRLPELLPEVRFVAVNTYSHTKALPKYRLWIPLSRMVTAHDYKVAWTALCKELLGKGTKGFDPAPSSPLSLFYLPCISRSGEAVWIDHGGKLLDPDPLVRAWHRIEALQARLAQEQTLRRPLPKASVAEVEAALKKVSPEDRNTWFRIGCALWHEFGEEGRLLWDVWSQGSSKYDRADQDKTWRSIRSKRVNKPITLGTVFALAKVEGGTLLR